MTPDQPPSNLERLDAQAQCEQLFLDFHDHIDKGRATQALALFHRDGTFEVRGHRHQGHDALARFLAAREADTSRRTRHLASNFRFTQESATAASATANLSLFIATGTKQDVLELEAVVDCHLRFTRELPGDWLMSSRRHVRFATAVDRP